MKKTLSVLLSVLMIVCSVAGAFNVSAASENLLADISTDDFGTNDTNKCPITGFEQYTDGTYGKVTDTSVTPIGKNIPLDKGGWSLFRHTSPPTRRTQTTT